MKTIQTETDSDMKTIQTDSDMKTIQTNSHMKTIKQTLI